MNSRYITVACYLEKKIPIEEDISLCCIFVIMLRVQQLIIDALPSLVAVLWN